MEWIDQLYFIVFETWLVDGYSFFYKYVNPEVKNFERISAYRFPPPPEGDEEIGVPLGFTEILWFCLALLGWFKLSNK